MTTFPISAPPLVPATEKIALMRKQGVVRSPFAGNTIVTHNYSEWQFELTFAPQNLATANAFEAWRDSLNGSVGTFTYSPRNSGKAITGKTLAAIAHAYTDTITVAGWSASAATGLTAGDYLSISNKLFRIVEASLTANGSGQATLTVAPSVRADIAAGTAVNFTNPTVILRMTPDSGDAPGRSRDSDACYLDSIKATEAL